LKTKHCIGWIGALLGVVVALGATPPAACADSPPLFGGLLDFPTIHGPADPEDYSWTVNLWPGQTLTQIDDQHAVLEYAGTQTGQIWAEPAHDVHGSSVPTSISVSEENIVTETVHHRAGDPMTGGTPFAYPIMPGPGYTIGDSTVTIIVPTELPPPPSQQCHVPELKGRSLKGSRRTLLTAHCSIGSVHHRRDSGKHKTVVKQGALPGAELPSGSRVWVVVGSA
jgi:hypothetical protein